MVYPGFPIGGVDLLGGCGPLMWALFAENVCKNEKMGSMGGGGRVPGMPPRSANAKYSGRFWAPQGSNYSFTVSFKLY